MSVTLWTSRTICKQRVGCCKSMQVLSICKSFQLTAKASLSLFILEVYFKHHTQLHELKTKNHHEGDWTGQKDYKKKNHPAFLKIPRQTLFSIHGSPLTPAKVPCARANADRGSSCLILSWTLVLKLRLVNWKDVCKHFAVQRWQDCRLSWTERAV